MKIVALSDDLMDRSKLAGALGAVGEVTFARTADAAAGADVVVIDLTRHAGAVATVRATVPNARIVAFGPHVDADLLAEAERQGADVVLPRSRFFQDPGAAVTG